MSMMITGLVSAGLGRLDPQVVDQPEVDDIDTELRVDDIAHRLFDLVARG